LSDFSPANSGQYFSLADCQIACNLSEIFSLDKSEQRKLIKITDILGREVNLRKNELMLYIFDDGTVEKRIIIE
jgi:hypothetical protein